MKSVRHVPILTLLCCFCFASIAAAVEPGESKRSIDQPTDLVDLFPAMDKGMIEVDFIALDASEANVLVHNKTDRVLHIRLPEAIAAVPVLAQFAGNAGQNFAGQDLFGGGGGGGNQSVGGGLNGPGLGQGMGQGLGQNGFGQNGMGQGNRFGNGFMRIAPEKTRKLKATTVCLEHGKPDPNPKVTYRMMPIQQYTGDVRVAELCRQLGRGQVKQKIAQAAAWHLANDLTWTELAKLDRLNSRYFGKLSFFSAAELKQANQWVATLPKTEDYQALSQN